MPEFEMARQAVKMLLRRIETGGEDEESVVLPGGWYEGETLAACGGTDHAKRGDRKQVRRRGER